MNAPVIPMVSAPPPAQSTPAPKPAAQSEGQEGDAERGGFEDFVRSKPSGDQSAKKTSERPEGEDSPDHSLMVAISHAEKVEIVATLSSDGVELAGEETAEAASLLQMEEVSSADVLADSETVQASMPTAPPPQIMPVSEEAMPAAPVVAPLARTEPKNAEIVQTKSNAMPAAPVSALAETPLSTKPVDGAKDNAARPADPTHPSPERILEPVVYKPAQSNTQNAAPSPLTAQQQPQTAIIDTVVDQGLSLDEIVGNERSNQTETASSRIAAAGAAKALGPTPVASLVNQIAATLSRLGEGRIDIRLDPPELGRLSIALTSTDGGTAAMVTAERQDVLDLLRRNDALLHRELKAAGFEGATLSFAQERDQSEAQTGKRREEVVISAADLSGLGADVAASSIPHSLLEQVDIRL